MKFVLVLYILVDGSPLSYTMDTNMSEPDCILRAVELSKQEWIEVASGIEVRGESAAFQCERE